MLLPVFNGPAGAFFISAEPVSLTEKKLIPPVDFTLPDDEGRPFVYDAEFRARRNSVLIWYRGHW